MFNDSEGKFCGQKFVNYVEIEGKKCTYDDTKKNCDARPFLPEYFDEEKIKRAQKFFEENIMQMMAVSMAGLIALLNNQGGIQLLIATNKSSEPVAAYKRYKDTMVHMVSWYRGEFRPGSKLWKSLTVVRNMHNAANKLGQRQGVDGITQNGMSGTLYGFLGLALARQKEFGLASASDEDLEALVHFWRVIGYTLGVDDDLSICRESLDETKAICRAISDWLAKHVVEKHPQSLMLQFAALDGNNMVLPTLESNVFLNFIHSLIIGDKWEEYCYPMNLKQRLDLMMFKKVLELCRYTFVRKLLNSRIRYTIYLMETYPEVVEHSIRGTDLLSLI